MNFLQAEREKCKNQKSGILEKIGRNPNSYNPSQIVEFLKKGIVSEQDLLDCNIPQSAIDNLEKVSSPMLTLGETPRPDDIPQGFTEVYFWGIPGSGKTCALGAVLHMAEKKGYLNIASSKGAKYAYQIKSIFSDDNIANDFLPSPTPLETTQYIPFILRKPNERHSRSVSLIEISGEIFTCFFSKHVHQPYPTQSHEDTFNSLETFLNSNNRKIHFFFIDYGRENKPMQDNLLQSDYLDAAASYFKSNKILEKKTDAIYIVLTKSDLMLDEHNNFLPPESRVEYAKQYLKNDNYNAFINTLKDSCKKFSINGGKLTVEPFSLGKVYFNTICNFEGSAASNIVDILMERIRPRGNNILDVFNK
ncbi:MAG: hypothetical protein KKD31_19080 [Bacteroidetes bacterium]|nr:hypothetical protein [Bacteroidota bacterium]